MGRRGVSVLFALCLAGAALAQQPVYPDRPAKGTFYFDNVGVLEQADANEINEIGAQVLREKGFPIIVVVIQSRASMQAGHLTIEQYARMLFNEWGIGTPQNNKGMLLLVSTTDRKARIELGAAWGGTVNNETDAVMQSRIVPQFKNNDYSEGLVEGARGLRDIAFRNNTYATPRNPVPTSYGGNYSGTEYNP